MHAQNFVVYKSGHGKLFEYARELFKQPAVLLVVARQSNLGLALPLEQRLVKTINVGETVALVITSQQEKVLWVLDLES